MDNNFLDLDLFAEPIAKASGSFETLTSQPTEVVLDSDRKVIYYYTVPENTSEFGKACLIFQLLAFADKEEDDFTYDDILSWYLTLFNLAYPQLMKKAIQKTYRLKFVEKEFTSIQIQYLFFGGELAKVIEAYKEGPEPKAQGDLGDADYYDECIDDMPVLQAPDMGMFGTILYSKERRKATNVVVAYGAVVTLTFTIGKTPTIQNQVQFRSRRPNAIRRLESLAELVNDQPEPFYPTIYGFIRICAVFSHYAEVKRVIGTTVVEHLNTKDPLPQDNLMIQTIALLDMAQMSHVVVIVALIKKYGQYLVKIEDLKDELMKFQSEYRKFKNQSDIKMRNFVKVIYGNLYREIRSREYSNLLSLARTIIALSNPTWKNYASQFGLSPHYDRLCQLVEAAGSSMPVQTQLPEAPVQTPGANLNA